MHLESSARLLFRLLPAQEAACMYNADASPEMSQNPSYVCDINQSLKISNWYLIRYY